MFIYAKIIKRKNIHLAGAPLYIYFVGFMGIALVTSSSFRVAHIGTTATMSLSIIEQIVISTIIDNLGLGLIIDAFGKKEFSFLKLIGIVLIIIGITLNQYSIKKQKIKVKGC